MGRALARLLNAGFPLRAALDIARGESIMGDEYLVVGDGGLAIAQVAHFHPNLCEIERNDGLFEVRYKAYPTSRAGIGSIVRPEIGGNSEHYISAGIIESFSISKNELASFLSLENIPLLIQGRLRWSQSVDLESL